ncbi:MAG: terminase family protein [Chloroflexota bacterium]|nr:terminase family protein [Chloroflexota bacterium]
MVALALPSLAEIDAEIERRERSRPWTEIALPHQVPPDGDWGYWLLLAGRGAGKSRTAAEWVTAEIKATRAGTLALVGPTAGDVRDYMVESPGSGLIDVGERLGFRPHYEPSKRKITWPNGAVGSTFSADEPDRLRGPNRDLAWSDELAAWKSLRESWDNLQFMMRVGTPRQIITTTPRPVSVVRELVDEARKPDRDVVITTGTTYDNAANLAPAFLKRITARYEGTRLGRQEIGGELLTDTPGALWTLAMIDAARLPADTILPLTRIVVGIDPAVSVGEDSDETGIIVAGIDAAGHGYVLEDLTGRYSPNEWATVAVSALDRWEADRIIAERNNGGQMVEHTIRTVRRNAPITTIHASRGKIARAEPVAALFEQGKVSCVGSFPVLEDQMTTFVPDIVTQSPDHLDAMVYALSDLMVQVTTTFARSY